MALVERQTVARRLLEARVMLIFAAGADLPRLLRTAEQLGIQTVELEGADPLELLSGVAGTGLVAGAGGISTPEQAWEAIERGARFLTADPLTSETAAVCEAADVASIATIRNADALSSTLSLRPDMIRADPATAQRLELPTGGPPMIAEVTLRAGEEPISFPALPAEIAAVRVDAASLLVAEELGPALRSWLTGR